MKPSFDTWTSIFLFAAIQGLFVATILLIKNRPVKKERIILSVIVLLFSITLVGYVLYWTRYNDYFPYILYISGGFTFLYGPLFYYYFRMIFENNKLKYTDLFSLIPFLISILYPRLFYIIPEIRKFAQIHSIPLVPWLSIFSMITYAILIYKKYKAESRSQVEIKAWFNYLFGFYLGFIFSFTSYFVLVMTPFFDIQYDYLISFSMSFFIYFLAWFGYMQPKIFAGFSVSEIVKHEKYSTSALTNDSSIQILKKLQMVMEKEKLFKQDDLNLEKLAQRLSVAKHHLSQVINEQVGMSYFDYINSLRVREATLLLMTTTKKEMNIIEIAFESGFNNKATFNSAFKKIMGMTPSEYREMQSETPPITPDKYYSN